MSYIQSLKEDHRQLLALAGEAEALLVLESPSMMPPPERERLRACLQRLIELLAAHGRIEEQQLFPALRLRLAEADHWQVKMIEVQDEAILTLARDLAAWSAGAASCPPEWVRESGSRLLRWLHEHVVIEEERLFPKLGDQARP
ncbi:MAG: hemerythrin domain-containing protein [Nitrospirota bacterium]